MSVERKYPSPWLALWGVIPFMVGLLITTVVIHIVDFVSRDIQQRKAEQTYIQLLALPSAEREVKWKEIKVRLRRGESQRVSRGELWFHSEMDRRAAVREEERRMYEGKTPPWREH